MWSDSKGNSVEDNVVAFNIMDENPEFSPEELYQKLEESYDTYEYQLFWKPEELYQKLEESYPQ